MTDFIKETIKELELDLVHEMENRTETNYNGMSISTCKRRVEKANEAEYLFEIGEISIDEAEIMVAEALV